MTRRRLKRFLRAIKIERFVLTSLFTKAQSKFLIETSPPGAASPLYDCTVRQQIGARPLSFYEMPTIRTLIVGDVDLDLIPDELISNLSPVPSMLVQQQDRLAELKRLIAAYYPHQTKRGQAVLQGVRLYGKLRPVEIKVDLPAPCCFTCKRISCRHSIGGRLAD